MTMLNKPINILVNATREGGYHNRLINLYLRGTVAKETEKAVQVAVDGDTLWLPKAALKAERESPENFTLAKWFTPDAYAARFIVEHQDAW